MDKFVVKTARKRSGNGKSQKGGGKHLKQTTIESLRGVVAIKDILLIKMKLKTKDQQKDVLLECLRDLGKKIPSKNILADTRIGHVVHKMRKHKDKEVSEMATVVCKKWKTHLDQQKCKVQIEVRCDLKTQGTRESARKLLSNSFGSEIDPIIAETIEQEVFQQCKKLTGINYRKTIKALVFALKQDDLKKKILSGSLTKKELVQQYNKM